MTAPTNSILATIKKMLGLDDDYTPFDMDVIMQINSALMKLTQLGIGPEEGFEICDYTSTWDDFLTNGIKLGGVQNYVYLQVKMLFDPPTNSYVLDAMKQQAEEIGWRLNVQAESAKKFDFMTEKSEIGNGGVVCHQCELSSNGGESVEADSGIESEATNSEPVPGESGSVNNAGENGNGDHSGESSGGEPA